MNLCVFVCITVKQSSQLHWTAGHGFDQAVPALRCHCSLWSNRQPEGQHHICDTSRRGEGPLCGRGCMRTRLRLGCPESREGEIWIYSYSCRRSLNLVTAVQWCPCMSKCFFPSRFWSCLGRNMRWASFVLLLMESTSLWAMRTVPWESSACWTVKATSPSMATSPLSALWSMIRSGPGL